MAGIFKIICTPIGNLADISYRASKALNESKIILSEDTRRARCLFYGLNLELAKKRFVSCHQHNEKSRFLFIMNELKRNNDIVLISDSGAPTISDPGGFIIRFLVKNGVKIEVIPGASAIIAALIGSGLNIRRYVFLGFLPRKKLKCKHLLISVIKLGFTVVIFESPFRVKNTLMNLYIWCGRREVVVARELTKRYETFHRGMLGSELSPNFIIKGEAVILVSGKNNLMK